MAGQRPARPAGRGNLDDRERVRLERALPWTTLLPGEEPVYVRSAAYLFGVAALAALMLLFASGIALAVFGPGWWHRNATGHFLNSLHFWSVQLFFLLVVAHLTVQFLAGTYRGRRKLTWVMGGASFFAAVFTAFTGYLSQTNFESQWIATQAKDAFNALGVGWLVNPLDSGQMLTMHVVVLPLGVATLVGVHLLLVRRRGVCPPYDARDEHLGGARPESGT